MLTKTEKVLILKGKQGCGKTFIFEFLRDYVYSTNAAIIVKSFDNVLCRFNGLLMGKLLVMIDETASVSEGSMTKKEQNAFKAMITGNTIGIEHKGKEILTIKNHITFAIATNSEHCADPEKGSRRERVFECNDIYVGNHEHLTTVTNAINKQNVGDAFYTYLRMIDTLHGADYLPNIQNVPNTDIRQELMDMSRTKANVFFDEVFDGSVHIPSELFHIEATMAGVKGGEDKNFMLNGHYYYLLKKDFYSVVYKPWHREYSTGAPWSEKAFSDHLMKHDKVNIIGGRKKSAALKVYSIFFT